MMRLALILIIAMAGAAPAQEAATTVVNGITLIDATKLSLEELMALADTERQNATRLHCCDWGGGGCDSKAALKTFAPGASNQPGSRAIDHLASLTQ